jgi:hypothetical protein
LIVGGSALTIGYLAGRMIASEPQRARVDHFRDGPEEQIGTAGASSSIAATWDLFEMDAATTIRSEPVVTYRSAASWPAILAGSAVILAMTLVMLSLGIGLGMSVVSPWGGSGVSATTYKVGTGIYFIVIAMISAGLGGHVTGRLRHRYLGIHDNEVYFRDTLHGLVAWALALIVGAALLASSANAIVGNAAANTAPAVASQSPGPAAGYVDRLLRAETPTSPPSGATAIDPRPELTRLVAAGLRDKQDLSGADRVYVAQVVARQTGLPAADAAKRVDDVATQMKLDLDSARKATLQLALWLTASLFMGAFAASIAAAEAGAFRDRNWGVRTTA